MHRLDRHCLRRDADHRRAGRDILGDDGIGADLGAFADLDRAEDLRARLGELEREIEELRKEVAVVKAARQPQPKVKSA